MLLINVWFIGVIMGYKLFYFCLIHLFIYVCMFILKLCLNVKKKDRASKCVFKV